MPQSGEVSACPLTRLNLGIADIRRSNNYLLIWARTVPYGSSSAHRRNRGAQPRTALSRRRPGAWSVKPAVVVRALHDSPGRVVLSPSLML